MKKIRIFQQHTHAGVTYPAGSEIELPDDVADLVLGFEHGRRAELIKQAKKVEKLKAPVEADRDVS